MSFLDRLTGLGLRRPQAKPFPCLLIHHSPHSIPAILDEIRHHCAPGGESDFDRCVECGVFFLPSCRLLVNLAVLANMARLSKSALNAGLQRAGFRKGTPPEDVLRELPALAALGALRQWTVFAPEIPPAPAVNWELPREVELPPVPVEAPKEPITPAEMAIAEFFGDDPFCLVPDFLLEDARQFICNKNR
jgi:hypothetical protein